MTLAIPDTTRRTHPWRDEIRATLALAWPIVLTNFVQTALGATDVVMMGWLGPEALAAGALATNLQYVFLLGAVGLVSATAPMVATELGRNRHAVREVRRTVRQGLWSAVAISLPVWVALWQAEPILRALGQEPALAAEAARYLHFLQWSLLPFLGYTVLRSFVSALERPFAALLVSGLGLLVNAVAVWALMFGRLGFPALGLAGAGIGTTVACSFMFLMLAAMIATDRRFRRYRLFGRFWRADWPRFRAFWRLGLPIGGAVAFEVGVFNAALFLMGLFGAAALAAHSIAIQIASLCFMVPLGLGQAVTVRVGRAYGAGDRDAIRRAGWTAFLLGAVFMASTAGLLLAAPRSLVAVFLDLADPRNAEVVALAVTFLGFAGLFQLVDGAQAVALGMLRGLHDTRLPMLIALLGYWGIGLPVGALLAFRLGFGGSGIWIGLAAGLAAVAVAMTLRWTFREELGLLRGAVRR